MKQLLLLRHAKSSWDDPNVDDHDRPLNERGHRDATRMGELLLEHKLIPDCVAGSTALRASTTARLVAAACGLERDVILTDRLYLAEPMEYLAILRELAEKDVTALLVGHNPGIEELVEQLTDQPARMPTAALAHIALPVSCWSEVAAELRGQLLALWYPRGQVLA
jgi:phosphohistidine phosphatase